MVTIVCNHFEEDASWMQLLGACEWVSIVVYDCGMAPLQKRRCNMSDWRCEQDAR